MIFGKTKMELKVGVFVFIGLGILAFFILSIGSFRTWAQGYEVRFIFDFINGVKKGAPVRFAGVDVGEVKRINFVRDGTNETQVEIVCWVEDRVMIPRDSTIWVNTLGLLGEMYVEVIPGDDLIGKDLILQYSNITGNVYNPDNTNSSGVQLMLVDEENNQKNYQTTLNGTYIFEDLLPGINFRNPRMQAQDNLSTGVGEKRAISRQDVPLRQPAIRFYRDGDVTDLNC